MKKTDLYLKPGTYIKANSAIGDIQGISLESFVVSVLNNPTCCAKLITSVTQTALDLKQNTLVSATNIKTIEGQSLLGSGNIDLGKGDVGLGNVDNTSDANKPVSTATQTALDLKLNINTYPALLKTSNNTVINSTLKTISDSPGNNTPLQLSTLRIGILSDSSVTTQVSSVIQSSTTNANLVIAPNGTGALVANIPDGTAVGGNARGTNAVDLQTYRTAASQVASGSYSTVLGGAINTASGSGSFAGGFNAVSSGGVSFCYGNGSQANGSYSFVTGEANIASGNNTVIIGSYISTANGNYSSVLGSLSGNATAQNAMVLNGGNASGINSVAINNSTSTAKFAIAFNTNAISSLYGQFSISNGANISGGSQSSNLIASKNDILTTGATTVLSLDGTGVTNLIIPTGSNRAWNIQVNWVAIVTTITGTATGISVGDVITSVDNLAFKIISGVSSASLATSTAIKLMVTTVGAYSACTIAYTAGASQQMALTFTAPTFVGGGSVTMRVVARIELAEVAF